MLKFDSFGIVVDTFAGDGGDSANRAGLLTLAGVGQPLALFEKRGLLVRHPNQEPWNHPGNFTRDQLLPFVAGSWKQGLIAMNRRIFWRHFLRGFFCQNFDRDRRGTRKYPFPHFYIDDRQQKRFAIFDFADILMPDHIFHLILCAELRPLYLFGCIGYPWLLLSILAHGLFNRSDDEGQIIAQCVRAGRPFVAFYRFCNPNWEKALVRYWEKRRQMGEIAHLLTEIVKDASYERG